jgi:hypothetical protein
MPVSHVKLSVVETAANGGKVGQIEIAPKGSRDVILRYSTLSVSDPDIVASTKTEVNASVHVGYEATAVTPGLGNTGAIMHEGSVIYADATPDIMTHTLKGDSPFVGALPIQPYNDGSYYLSLHVKGTSCTGVKSAQLQAIVTYNM